MSGAPGFVRHPQKPAPDPQKLGLALMQQGQQQGAMPPAPEAPMLEDEEDPLRQPPRWRF